MWRVAKIILIVVLTMHPVGVGQEESQTPSSELNNTPRGDDTAASFPQIAGWICETRSRNTLVFPSIDSPRRDVSKRRLRALLPMPFYEKKRFKLLVRLEGKELWIRARDVLWLNAESRYEVESDRPDRVTLAARAWTEFDQEAASEKCVGLR